MARPWTFLLILAAGVVADLWTKDAAFEAVPLGTRHEVIADQVYIAPTRNPGAMWSNFQDVPAWLWVVIRGSIALGLLIYYIRNCRVAVWVHLAFAFVLAGAVGNLHDNMFAEQGEVRDFILVYVPMYGWWPTFNIADSMICVGAILLLWHFLRLESPGSKRSKAGDGDASPKVGPA